MRRSVKARIISALFTVSQEHDSGACCQRDQQVGDLRQRMEQRQDSQDRVPLVDPDDAGTPPLARRGGCRVSATRPSDRWWCRRCPSITAGSASVAGHTGRAAAPGRPATPGRVPGRRDGARQEQDGGSRRSAFAASRAASNPGTAARPSAPSPRYPQEPCGPPPRCTPCREGQPPRRGGACPGRRRTSDSGSRRESRSDRLRRRRARRARRRRARPGRRGRRR